MPLFLVKQLWHTAELSLQIWYRCIKQYIIDSQTHILQHSVYAIMSKKPRNGQPFMLPLFADSIDSGQELERKFIGENIWIIKELCQ